MLCITEDLFLPLPIEYLLVNLKNYKNNIIKLLEEIKEIKLNSHIGSNKLLIAIKAANLLVQSTGGKIIGFSASQSFVQTV